MRANLDIIMSVSDAMLWFTKLRGPELPKVTRATIDGWAARYSLEQHTTGAGQVGYRYGDLLQADARARKATIETRRVA